MEHLESCFVILFAMDYLKKLTRDFVFAFFCALNILIKHFVKADKLAVGILSCIHDMGYCIRLALSADIAGACTFDVFQLVQRLTDIVGVP